jgi:hypothetical protein
MPTHTATHFTTNVFIPFLRDNWSREQFQILLDHIGVVEEVTVYAKRASDRLKQTHFYAFMTMRPCEYSRGGRELSKNLKSNTTTFVPFSREGEDVYMELKPYLNKQERIERGYSGVTLYLEEDDSDVNQDDDSAVDDDDDFDTMMREVDDTRQEWYSLWTPSSMCQSLVFHVNL